MPLQDLTPELRTRLSRVERTVGWFVTIATLILLAGFLYYIYATAERRGWFVTKINYATSLDDASGFTVGDPVKLMGFNVGEITRIDANAADKKRGVTIFFNIRDPYFGYIWWDSQVRVTSDFLGHRALEVVKGIKGRPSVYKEPGSGTLLVLQRYVAYVKYQELLKEAKANAANTNAPDFAMLDAITNQLMDMIKTQTNVFYTNAVKAGYTRSGRPAPGTYNYYWIAPLDSPSLSDRLDAVAKTVETALPNVLQLTNQLAGILSNASNAVARLDSTLAETHPILTNVAVITGNLRDPNGSLGNWILSPTLTAQLHQTLETATATLQSAHATLDSTDTNLTMVATDLDHTLQHLSDLTSNLSWQVQMNTNLVTDISTTIVHTDQLIQGLKRTWFLRSAFKNKGAKAPKSAPMPAR
ncbi:MAG TPA: MlaD family protein [Candidatus Saccharimonadales bacterium]|nr:MlaD family protein [Candidatus Saccharimonadales bacterium]